jgi:hypothetical protein
VLYDACTVKSVLSGHPGNQKLLAVEDGWLFKTDCFNRECAADGQKQIDSMTQMTVKAAILALVA